MTSDLHVAYRALDANLNRAMEALRTLEDIARFDNLAHYQSRYKRLRHDLHAASASWDASLLLTARDVGGDVGREVKTEQELLRPGGTHSIAHAAAQRSQQSLRCLEEFSKLAFPSTALHVEGVRYHAYQLNASFLLALDRDRAFLNQSQLYVLVDCQLPVPKFASRIREMSRAGVDLIQIRDKALDALALMEYTRAAIDAVRHEETRIIVNDRVDVARVARAWGVHVGQTDIPIVETRTILSPRQVVGTSTHSIEQIEQAVAQGADYIGCGPTFSSTTKHFDALSGVEFLSHAAPIAQQASLPAFAIGGITLENLPQILDAGFTRVAVGSAIWNDQAATSASKIKSMLVDKASAHCHG